jgi:UDP-N-acetylmuramoyl-tripeptide--D-alanyl-D-alanine ligase
MVAYPCHTRIFLHNLYQYDLRESLHSVKGAWQGVTLVLQRPVIAVTGSAGKSTTKEMIASILQTRWKVFKSPGNMNHLKSTAKNAKLITSVHRAAVLEYGMTRRGHIRRHCQYVQPNIGVITNVGTAHIGNFGGDTRKVALAKSELIQNMKQTGLLILNADDDNSRYLVTRGFNGKIRHVGVNRKADYQASSITQQGNGLSFQVKLNGTDHAFFVPILGRHNIYNALSAIAAAAELGFSPEEMQKGLRSFRKLGRRLIVYRLPHNIRVIDDTFSANPNAVKAAINVLTQMAKHKKIAVLGTMLEMGVYSAKGHRDVGRYAAQKQIDYLLTYGKEAGQIGKGAIAAGLPAARVFHFVNRDGLHQRLLQLLEANATVLVKGSHRLAMNQTVQFLRARKGTV